LHTEVVDVNVENATANLADGVIEMRKRQGEVLLKGGTLKVLRIGRNPTPSRGYFYQITQQGIVFSDTPMF
jgi:KaiC/GvpD/RAD55 family RecA-like ATPase